MNAPVHAFLKETEGRPMFGFRSVKGDIRLPQRFLRVDRVTWYQSNANSQTNVVIALAHQNCFLQDV